MGPGCPPGRHGAATREGRLSLRPAWGGGRRALRAPTWFLACLYRACFKVSESKVELRTSFTSDASSAALRRSSPFPKVGIGSKAKRPPACCRSAHLHQGPGEARCQPRPRPSRPRPAVPARRTASPRHMQRRQTHGHVDTRTEPHGCRKLMDRGPRKGEYIHMCCKQQVGHPGLQGQG